ncbi:MAG: 30S ribosomal protein S10 [Alphaproteobacteria bacterium]|jgi:small subunit ribosomal protein S10|nr:30S ribosomal protein S10 [Alphaproteobacteria bacterium]
MKQQSQKIRIRLRAYSHRLLDKAAQEILRTATRTDAIVKGPIPLPVHIAKFTVNRSPHIDKKSREQFEVRTHKRVLELWDPTPQTIEQLMKLELPSGVDVDIKL